MELLLYVLDVLLYCLIGSLFLVAYILVMNPPKQATTLGLIMLFWPLVLLLEAVLLLGSGFGHIGIALSNRLKKVA